jgi:hypothetical protein
MEGVTKEWVGRCSREEAPDIKCTYSFGFGLVVWGFLMSLEGVTEGEAILVPGQGIEGKRAQLPDAGVTGGVFINFFGEGGLDVIVFISLQVIPHRSVRSLWVLVL